MLRLTRLPPDTQATDSFFLAGSINKWNPRDTNYLFKKGVSDYPELFLPLQKAAFEFKITRGNWNNAEADSNGNDISNRNFTFSGNQQTIDLAIRGWKMQTEPVSTAASNVKIFSDSFFMPQLGRKRRIWIYLPPDYASSQKTYPVIYMHDGQNLFDNRTAFAGEWGVDETLNTLHAGGDYGAIVVGIDNGGENRLNEYSPWRNKAYGGGEGNAYIDFIRNTLKPLIDSTYRTKKGPENTCLWGSSMGGLISACGVLKYPETFGLAGIFSPSYWFAYDSLKQSITNPSKNYSRIKLIHVAGEKEGANMKFYIQKTVQAFSEQQVPLLNLRVKIDPDGAHNEGYWKREFAAAYQWLFSGKNP